MRKLKVIMLALGLLIVSSVSATAAVANLNDPSTVAVKEISSLLKNPQFYLLEDSLVVVKFIVNSDHELVVLSTDTKNSEIENFIKSRMNYKKISCDLKVGVIYTQPVQLVRKN